jgi:transcriptional regulator with XRE-family HTH domain
MSKFVLNNSRASKLTNEQVFELRRLYNHEGWSQRALGEHFNLSVNHVGRLVRGESRRAVPMALPKEDHTAVQRRLTELQEQQGAIAAERIIREAQRIYDTEIKPAKELDELVNPSAVKKFGVIKGDSQ